MYQLEIIPGKLSLKQLREVSRQPTQLSLTEDALPEMLISAEAVAQVIKDDKVVYGINTGFGLLANTRIAAEDLETLQRSIVLSHAAGIGTFMDDATVRMMIVLKVNSLSRGYSGIRPLVVNALMQLVNTEVYPCIPKKGSVGASGDLAPLAHMSTVLLGEGEARYQGEVITGAQALEIAGLEPITLAPKEGLALLNGTQASTAFALEGFFAAEDLYAAATVCGAMSVDAALGSRRPFDPRIHRVRGHRSQIDAAMGYRHMLGQNSEIGLSHQQCEKVQDPYSLRCQPQVMGACLQQIRNSAVTLEVEANAVSDNPLVFADDGDIISGGNFHAEPVAMAADNLALAIAEIGSLSERRMALLIDSGLSKLPPFLVDNGGVNSGFMIAQVTAAALASENKSLAHPASVDSLPTSANQEDHVSMATFAARRLTDMAENTRGILAVELLAAAQGLDFRSPNKSSELIEQAKMQLRERVSFYDKDRYFAPDIAKANQLLKEATYNALMPATLLPSL
ncbi:histidine ammonia-lyase [Photobacterium profundum]|uniref:Histidine ammonia-lyase n=1 Tax=Photobacterium profundum (strain SS9) TaxID=298386 RepID=HUTH_PHOPR|nr:histidine ammonia-lyase [Photobacterium profundum]Q6LQ56.1 RecName: Full=Histidine ammonia-lyase; Short=Histidase [Photobacterium profundum SS9]CAG20570.1 putative histidine ammonia-lyase [Photobacterium profundum SS9]